MPSLRSSPDGLCKRNPVIYRRAGEQRFRITLIAWGGHGHFNTTMKGTEYPLPRPDVNVPGYGCEGLAAWTRMCMIIPLV
jgi:hypothetical protein